MDKKDQPGWFDRWPIHVDEIARIERDEYADFAIFPTITSFSPNVMGACGSF
ncbi:hypothetical protein [Bremerella sp.]|uniref:hypothetical protein n=1 Tax=Bremerella sp. TaxID=2795602 RepID=UPI00391D2B0A